MRITKPSRCLALASPLAVLLLLAPAAHAFRPFDGTDAQVSPPRALETEISALGYQRVGSERVLVMPQVVLNYGAGAGLEFALEGSRLMPMTAEDQAPDARYEDLDLVVKKVLRNGVLQQAKGPSIATEEAVLMPTTEERGTGFSGSLILSQRWPMFGLHLNGAVSRTRVHEIGRFASVIGEGPDHWAVRPVTELSIEREGSDRTSHGVLLGFLWQTRDGLTMDLGARIADGDEHGVALRTGLTFKKHVPKGPKVGKHSGS